MPATLTRASDGELLLDTGMARGAAPARVDRLALVLAAIAIAAILVPALIVGRGVGRPAYHDVIDLPRRIVPRIEVPRVDPVRLIDLTPDAARAYNAAQPFATTPIPAARPFRFAGSADELARATDCLAAAVLYEAGDDTTGERAVAQVVLNRLRHPAFPKSVCGVVFEGAERTTGCQFTFTCDGALARWKPSEAGWRRAREVAGAALAGTVDRTVGYATHYHTDWVVPYWQSSLDKIAAVHTHLFFRWSGWWGTPPAFDRHPVGGEPVIAPLAAISPAHGAALGDVAGDGIHPALPFFGRTLRPLAGDPDTFLTSVDPGQSPESYRTLALQACAVRVHCKVLGWSDATAMAFTLPLTAEAQAALSFSYLRDRTTGFDKALWNCAEFHQVPAGACMKKAPPRPAAAEPPREGADGVATPATSIELGGVHRRGQAAAPGAMAPARAVPDPAPSPSKAPARTAPAG